MDKQKLVRIIIKELDELKILSEEVGEIQDDTSLIVDLALSKARLLCQEIELLREYSGASKTSKTGDQEDVPEDEDSEMSYSDPELEILHFDVPDLEENIDEMEEEPEDLKENKLDDLHNPDEQTEKEQVTEEETAEDLNLQEDEPADENDKIVASEEPEEEEIIVYDEDEDELAERAENDEEPEPDTEVQVTELETDTPHEVREIRIDELEDEDSESFKFAPATGSASRPAMHEIPKPENVLKEKPIVAESFHKERSLNEVMAENKSAEPKLTSGPITSLRASIGLNDRFLFIREIFGNNAEKYNTVIDQLDKLETIQQAVEYLKSTLSLEKNATSMKFVDLLKRRFSK